MDNQVTQLKKKVKTLQKQLCDRTRNYLYHFKKSPTKQNYNTQQRQTQTQFNDPKTQDTTQTQTNQDDHFTNVNLINYQNKTLSQSNQQISPQISQKTEIGFTLDLTDIKFDNQLKQENQKHRSEIDGLALQIRLMKQQLQKSKTPRNKNDMKFQFFHSPINSQTPIKQNSNLQFSKKKDFQTIQQQSDLKSNAQSAQRTIQHDYLGKQIKIMKKQIKKLKTHLQKQVQASSYTKQALLVSQQENYKFRLKIQRLNKQIQILTGASTDSQIDRYQKPLIFEAQQPALSSIDSDKSESTKQQLQKFKNQAQKYEEHIFILQGVKRDYLKKCIQAKQGIYKLKQENQKLKAQVKELKILIIKKQNLDTTDRQKNQFLPDKSQELTNKQFQTQWSQVFKSKIHQISNCLPVGDNQQMFLFKPDTIQDLISMLERILVFCKNIQIWQKEKIQAIQRQRSNLLRIISATLMRHPETKQALAEQILQIQELKYLVNFLNKQQKGNKVSKIYFDFDRIQIKSKDPVVGIQTS